MNSRVTIVIPVYNEELNISSVVNNVLEYAENIIIVNDKSTDNTSEYLKNLESKHKESYSSRNSKNRGIGYSVKKGFTRAEELDNDIVIKFDGTISTWRKIFLALQINL